MPDFIKDQIIPLNFTQEAEHRVFVGLGWDPNESHALRDKIGALIGHRANAHDLDLSCFYYDEQNSFLGYVTADPEHYHDASGKIYHSGDNAEGIGDGDDEQISLELKTMPHNIHHLIFKASIKSGHNFGDVKAPEIRLCDGYTGRCFVETALHQKDSKTASSFIFVRISREDNGWLLHSIGDFSTQNDLDHWKVSLARYIP